MLEWPKMSATSYSDVPCASSRLASACRLARPQGFDTVPLSGLWKSAYPIEQACHRNWDAVHLRFSFLFFKAI